MNLKSETIQEGKTKEKLKCFIQWGYFVIFVSIYYYRKEKVRINIRFEQPKHSIICQMNRNIFTSIPFLAQINV